MSDARAIEAVTLTLLGLIRESVNAAGEGFGGEVIVDAQPPSEVQTGTDRLRVNLFLFETDVDPALRNEDPLDRTPGESGDQPLPLVLHYLLTPYVQDGRDRDGHRLLGLAVRALHEHTLLGRGELAAVAPFSDVGQQLDRIRITWQELEEKDIFSLWSAFQTPYRLSVAFEVRAVLIDSRRPPTTPVPVLRRGSQDEGPVAQGSVLSPFPDLGAAIPVSVDTTGIEHERAATPVGGRVVLRGTNLAAPQVRVVLTHPLLADPVTLNPTEVTATEVRFDLTGLPSGLVSVSLELESQVDGEPSVTVTNEVPLSVSPVITSAMPMTVARDGSGTATVALACAPPVLAGQPVLLLLGSRSVAEERELTGDPVTGAALRFPVPDAPVGVNLVRLRVGGVDSPLVDRSGEKPKFDETQRVTVT